MLIVFYWDTTDQVSGITLTGGEEFKNKNVTVSNDEKILDLRSSCVLFTRPETEQKPKSESKFLDSKPSYF